MFTKITNEKIVIHDGYPLLEVTLDGKIARIKAEQKPTLVKKGIIFIGTSFRGRTEVQFEERTLNGFSDDPNLFALYQRFLKANRGNNYNGFEADQIA